MNWDALDFAVFGTMLLVVGAAFAGGLGSTSPGWPKDVAFLTALFVVMWLGSAWLFRKAARQPWVTK